MKSSLKIGLLGAGSIGLRHAVNLDALGITEIAFWEPHEEARKRARGKTAAHFLESREAFWQWDPDVVFVCTPSHLHEENLAETIQRNKDVFVEKPVATSLKGCRELADLAKRRGLVTMAACNMRFHAGPATIKKLLEEKRIGEIFSSRLHVGSYLPRWRPWQDYRKSYSADPEHGGAILDAIHEVDLALWLFGPARMLGGGKTMAKSLELETDGLAEFVLRHRDGVISSVHLNFLQRDYRRYCQVLGTGGSLYWDFMRQSVQIFGEEGTLAETIDLPPSSEVNEMYLREMEHFLGCVASRETTCNSLHGGIEALEIALQARALKA